MFPFCHLRLFKKLGDNKAIIRTKYIITIIIIKPKNTKAANKLKIVPFFVVVVVVNSQPYFV